MSPTPTIIALSALALLALLAIAAAMFVWLSRRTLDRRVKRLNEEMLAASRDASVGRRMTIPNDPDTGQLAQTVNRLFDALAERDEKIQRRDQLFKDFARTLPEIVIIHDEKILLANDAAGSLIGLDSTQLVGREIADLV
ncbi:MAG: PAS domain-containing protein, partial [Gammaproteobacteria bacterium]|nr:PAS domain-containing protein [Gammaproteobacteria bacterium]